MIKKYTIGVDIGGTNTDAVVVDDASTIIAATKTSTTDPVSIGFMDALKSLLESNTIKPEHIESILVGTTHATNALLQAKDLFRVGVLRLGSESSKAIPPCLNWPPMIKKAILADYALIDGGFHCDGRIVKSLNKEQIEKAIERFVGSGVESIAITGIYSSIDNSQEIATADSIRTILGQEFPISMSHDLGGVGFIERENATIINAALKKCMQQGFQELTSVLNDLKIHCPLYVTQNNGTILPLEKAILYPLLTISAGPTNSFIGAAKLAALNNAVIADIGGTSTDVGIVLDGFARRSINTANIAGISLNFSMPDVLSIALGGGSYVKLSEGCMAIGPESCGKNIKRESRCFGGNALTLTDIAVAEGLLSMEGVQIPVVEKSLSRKVFGYIENQLRELKRKMAGIHKDLPLIVVGGGAELLRNCSFAQEYIIPDHANVANAYGAALAEVSGTVDTVISLINRDKIIADLTAQAIDQAQKNGAQKDTIRIIDKYILPFHYMPHNLARVRIVAVGKRKQ